MGHLVVVDYLVSAKNTIPHSPSFMNLGSFPAVVVSAVTSESSSKKALLQFDSKHFSKAAKLEQHVPLKYSLGG